MAARTGLSGVLNSTCPYCGVGCGVAAEVDGGQVLRVVGDPAHPANQGRLCVKGMALRESLGAEGRLLRPRLKGEDCGWDTALDYTARRLRAIIRRHGPDAVAFYLSGQLLTEDYYVANKLMKGFIGSANVDTNSRLCMASATVAHKRAFGEDLVPGCYADLEAAELILLAGSNAAYAHPIVFQRIVRARERNPGLKVVVLDPRRTATCEVADLHLALRPGSDAYFFNGLLAYLADHGGLDARFLALHCEGFEASLAQARRQGGLAETARLCDLPPAELVRGYELFARRSRVVTLFSQGINQSASGVDKGNAIINCHLASGKIGRPGAAPFSITGQPNAMGGREVGGLANQLAAHMQFENADEIALVERFWHAPRMARKPGLKAVDLFEAVHDGRIKAVWIMATNPAVSMPEADRVREALARCELTIVSECYADTDTLRLADVAFPAAAWSEKCGTVTNSERRISLQRALVPPPGEAWPDWKIVCALASRLGFGQAFPYRHPAEIFSEHAALSGYANHGTRGFDISGLAGISRRAYEALAPIQWPVNPANPKGRARFFEDGRFFHPDGKARLVPVVPEIPRCEPQAGQFILNNGRLRDQWHTMTRTGRVPRLLLHAGEPCLEIHPADAVPLALADGALAEVGNTRARLLLRVRHSEGQRRGEVFAPIHWNERFSALARVSSLIGPARDPLSGQPEFKQCAVTVRPWTAAWSGVLLSRSPCAPATAYWTRIPLEKGVKYLLADSAPMPADASWLQARLPGIDDWVQMKDSEGGHYRLAGFRENRLEAVLLCESGAPGREDGAWLEGRLGETDEHLSRFLLLAGNDTGAEPGPIVCSCFQVGRRAIEEAVAGQACASVEALGQLLGCGTNCGSCLPELRALLQGLVSEGLVSE